MSLAAAGHNNRLTLHDINLIYYKHQSPKVDGQMNKDYPPWKENDLPSATHKGLLPVVPSKTCQNIYMDKKIMGRQFSCESCETHWRDQFHDFISSNAVYILPKRKVYFCPAQYSELRGSKLVPLSMSTWLFCKCILSFGVDCVYMYINAFAQYTYTLDLKKCFCVPRFMQSCFQDVMVAQKSK